MIEQIRHHIKRIHQKNDFDLWVIGTMGKHEGSSVIFDVPGRAGYVFVTIRQANGAQTTPIARNEAGVEHSADLPVRMREENKEYVIRGKFTRPDIATVTPPPPSGVPVHLHNLADLNDVTITAAAAGDVLVHNGTDWVDSTSIPIAMAATIDAATEQTVPEAANRFPLTDTGVLKWISWTNILVALNLLYGQLAVANTWVQNQIIASTQTTGNALRVIRNLTSTSTDAPVVDIVQDHATDDQAALRVQQDGTGAIVEMYDGASLALAVADGGGVTLPLLTAKVTPVDADGVLIRDSAASSVVKETTWANVKATFKTYYDSVVSTLTNKTLDSTNISTFTAKNPPIDADSAVIVDSAAANVFKAVTYTNIKAFLKTYFDTLYGLLATANTWTANNAFNSTATSGSALSVTRNLTATSTDAPVVSIVQDHASDDQVALKIQQDANISALDIVSTLIGVLKMRVINSSANAGAYASYQLLNDISNIGAFFLLSSTNGGYAGANSFNMVQAGNFSLGFGTNDIIRMKILNDGTVRAHDGTAGWMFVSVTGVVGSEVEIVAAGAEDVAAGFVAMVVCEGSAGTTLVPTALTAIQTPGAGSTDSTISALITFRLHSTGQLTVLRASGTETWSVAVNMLWQ